MDTAGKMEDSIDISDGMDGGASQKDVGGSRNFECLEISSLTAPSSITADSQSIAQSPIRTGTQTSVKQTPERIVPLQQMADLILSTQLPDISVDDCCHEATGSYAEIIGTTVDEEGDKDQSDQRQLQSLLLPMECAPKQIGDANDVVMAESNYDATSETTSTDVEVSVYDVNKAPKIEHASVEVTSSPVEESPSVSDLSSLNTVPHVSSIACIKAVSVKSISPPNVVRAVTPMKSVSPIKAASCVKVASLVKVASSMNTAGTIGKPAKAASPVKATTSVKLFGSSMKSASSVMKVASSVKVVSSAKASSARISSQRGNPDCGDPSASSLRSLSIPIDSGIVNHSSHKTPLSNGAWGEEEAVSSEEGAEAMSEGGDSIETEPEVVTERDAGFKVNWLALRDAASGRLLWASDIDLASGDAELRVVAKIPKEVLHLDAIHRELNFSTSESLDDFRLEQRVLFKGRCLEEWYFHLGAVEPTSSQTWTSVFHSTPECQLMPFETLNGHLLLYTCFLDGADLLAVSTIEIIYV